jgi:hypothetical protein
MSNRAVQKRFWKILTITLFFLGGLLLFGNSFVEDHYYYSRPRVAQPDLGRIYALNYHGVAVYLTKVERFWLYFLEGTGAICLGASLLIWGLVLKGKRLDNAE